MSMNQSLSTQAHPGARSKASYAILKSTPETLLWGYLAANVPPALTIKSGAIVEIDTLSHQGLLTNQDPMQFFAAHGIAPDQVLPDAAEVYSKLKRPKGASVHLLTGPLYVEGAEPGDALEVRILDIKFRVPYGVNNTGPRKGVLPGLVKEPTAKLIRLELSRNVEAVGKVRSKHLRKKRSPYLAFKRRLGSRDHLGTPNLALF